MSRIIFTEDEKKEIIQTQGITEEQYQMMSIVPDKILFDANRMSPFLVNQNRKIKDGYLDFVTWTENIQPTIENLFGVDCSRAEVSDSESESRNEIIMCILVWRLIVKILTYYVTSKYTPLSQDIDGKQFMSVLNVINQNQEIEFIAKQILSGQSVSGKLYTPKIQSNVFIRPDELENKVIVIYNNQRKLFL